MCHKTALWWFIAVLQRRLGPQILFSRWYRSQQTPQNCDFQRFLGENENYDAKTTFPLIISYITIFICVVKVIADSFLSLYSVLYYMINVVAGAGLVSRLLLSLHRCLTPLCSQPGLSIVRLCHCELLFSLSLSLLITCNRSSTSPVLIRKHSAIQPAVLIDFFFGIRGQMVLHLLLHFSHLLNRKLYVSSQSFSSCYHVWSLFRQSCTPAFGRIACLCVICWDEPVNSRTRVLPLLSA